MLPSLDTSGRDGGNLMNNDVFTAAFQPFHDSRAPRSVIAEFLRCDTIPTTQKVLSQAEDLQHLPVESLL